MRLHIGERLPGAGPASQPGGYVVTEVIHETPWTGWYAGKKVFYNFDFTNNRPRETDDKEWLDVHLRTLHYPHLDDRDDVIQRRRLAHAESRWLGRGSSNIWPEPLDLLEIDNTRDPFSFSWNEVTTQKSLEREPVLVLARPHGQLLRQWRKQALPVSAMLAVLAELLHLVHHAHHEGLILNGLGPDALLVDRADRLHYVGTDMVMTSPDRGLNHAVSSDVDWSRLFPAQRYPRGYAAPECFDAERLPNESSDLYAWAVLVYVLLTGKEPDGQIPDPKFGWLQFRKPQFEQLEKALRSIPPAHVQSWAQQLGIAPDTFLAQWPHSFLAVFRSMVSPLQWQRPSSVAELRSWLTSPPPAPVAAVLAIQQRPNKVRIHWRFPEDADPDDYEVIVRRSLAPPQHAEDGDLVAQGDGLVVCDDSVTSSDAEDVFYSVFVRPQDSTSDHFSPGYTVKRIAINFEKIRRYVEEDWQTSAEHAQESARIQLLFDSLDLPIAAEALYGSHHSQLRYWAAHRLADQPVLAADEPVLWKALRDSDRSIQWEAARGVLQHGPDLQHVVSVVEQLGEGVDEQIEWARSLDEIGIDETVIQKTIAELEGKRPTTCPICDVELTGRDRTVHLCTEHGWVEALGNVWPRDEALIRLWDRVFREGDVTAHRRLCTIIERDDRTDAEDGSRLAAAGRSPYIVALEREIERLNEKFTDDLETTITRDEFANLLSCIQNTTSLQSRAPDFLQSENEQVRELGRELILPELCRRLDKSATAKRIRDELDRLCPDTDLLAEKILLCKRLAPLGVDSNAVNVCLQQLQDERPARCTECRKLFRLGNIEAHLRRDHQIFEYQGVRRTYDETRDFLLKSICGTSPDYRAWQTLEAITRERHDDTAASRLAAWICQSLRTVSRERRLHALGVIAEAAAQSELASSIVTRLTEPFRIVHLEAPARALALAIVTRLPPPVDHELLQTVQPLLAMRTIPLDLRQKATAALLRTTGSRGPASRQLLQAYLGETGKVRSIEKLQQLEPFAGHVTEIDLLQQELEDQVRMQCPRCSTELRRFQMVSHLWDEHRLVLEGRRVREPWRVISDWLDDYRLEKDEAVLERCRDLAEKLDGHAGQTRLNRMMLERSIANQDALQELLHQARQDASCICPHCFHRAPPPRYKTADPFRWGDKTLAGHGYHVELQDGGLFPRAEIRMPDGAVVRCLQIGGWLTRAGAVTIFVSPLVAVVVGITLLLAGPSVPIAGVLLVAIGATLFLGGMVYLLWPGLPPAKDRLVDLAWQHLAPRWLDLQLQPDKAGALHDLAVASRGHGNPTRRFESLQKMQQLSDQAEYDDERSIAVSASAWRLAIEDVAGQGNDPLPWLINWASLCFTGQRPFAWLDEFLDGLDSPDHSPAWWTAHRRARFDVLICEKAFEARLEVADLVEMGKAFPRLGRLLRWDDETLLAHRRFVWSKMTSAPWKHFGEVNTVFDLAHDPAEGTELLQQYPDLLLHFPSVPALWCVNGVIFENRRIHEMPSSIDVLERDPYGDEGFDMVLGNETIWFRKNPDRLAQRLERCLRFLFFEMQPQVSAALQWRSDNVTKRLRRRNAEPCPNCGEQFLPIVGELGLKCDVIAGEPWA